MPTGTRISGISSANASALIAPPRNSAPVSPINTLAGLKLKKRNTTSPPKRAAAKTATDELCHASATAVKNSATGIVTPVTSPSTPSVILTALTVATIIKAEKIRYIGSGSGMLVPTKGI